MVYQLHGGAIRRGYQRIANPTASDVSELARKRLFKRIPELNRIAANKPRTPRKAKGKEGADGSKPVVAKRPYRVADQIRGDRRAAVTRDARSHPP